MIDSIRENHTYASYEPEKYHCVAIDDDYLNDWWDALSRMKFYHMSLNQPQTALNRWGITLIPPESLDAFLKIVTSDPRFASDGSLAALAELIRKAKTGGKYMIHFGV